MSSALGPLEQTVMNALWDRPDPASVRDLHPLFSAIAYTTLMTTLDRLYRKGLLDRAKHGRAFFYHPRLTRSEYKSMLATEALRMALENAVGEREHQLLEELASLVRARRLAE